MSDLLKDWVALPPLQTPQIRWLIEHGVPWQAIAGETDSLRRVCGEIAADGWFDVSDDGQEHVACLVTAWPDDAIEIAVWQPLTGRVGSYYGRAFAFGQAAIDNPATYAFDGGLRVHRTPLEWLQASREGICIIRPEEAHIRLRHAPRLIAVDVEHGREIRSLMTLQAPSICVVAESEAA